MDEKMMALFQEGKYFKGIKRYLEIAASESVQLNQVSDNIPSIENQPLRNQMSQKSGRNSQMIQQSPKGSTGQRAPQSQGFQQSVRPTHQRITKESIIKYDRNSSAGSVALALLLVIILSIIFVSTI